jgi:hypothetical protein
MASCLPHRLLAILVLGSGLLLAAPPPPLTTVPVAEGDQWQQAVFLGPFVQPDGLGMPQAATSARIRRDAEGLHIQVVCAEPRMGELAMGHTGRDAEVWKDDCVEVFLGTPRLKPYAHFVVNPVGAKFDELGRDARWNGEWQAKAGRSEAGWQVELTLPWRTLGGAPKPGETWHLNICRSRRPVAELACWAPTGGGFHVPDRFGVLRFADGPVPTALAWNLPSPTRGEVHLSWLPPKPAPKLTVNGRPADNGFAVAKEGNVPLWLEARAGRELVYRTLHVARIVPVHGLVAAVERQLAQIPEHPATAPAVAELREEFSALQELSRSAPPKFSRRLESMLSDLRTRASHLAVRARLLADKAPADGIVYGIESPLRKLLRHEPFAGQAGGTLKLDAARNEMAAAQVVLFAFGDPLLMARGQFTACKSKSGDTLPAEALRLRRVGYVHTCQPVYRVPYVGIWPDPLMAATPFDVKRHSFETLWADVRVPAGTKPGIYRGTLRLVAKNTRPTEVPVEVRVRSFTIPSKPSLVTAFGLSPNWRVKQDRDAYVRNYLEHRVTPYSVAPSPTLVKSPLLDWRQARELRATVKAATTGSLTITVVPREGAPLVLGPEAVPPGKPCAFSLDLGSLNQPVLSWQVSLAGATEATLTAQLVGAGGTTTLCKEQTAYQTVGEDGWIKDWPTWSGSGWDRPDIPAVWDWTEFDQALDTYLPLGLSSHRLPLRRPLGGWAKALQKHLSETGRLDLFYTYLFDEPTPDRYPLLNQVLGEVKRNAPGIKNMMTARSFPPELKYVDIWCPEAYSFDPEAAKAEQKRGRDVWWYVAFSTRHPYPNIWIDYPALDCRVWPWMTWKHNIDGMLYWSGTAWSRNDPWRTGETFHNSNGDGSAMYPGDDGHPVDSIRWECLRDGMEDYEVFCLLEAGARELRAAKRDLELAQTADRLCAIDNAVVRSYKDYSSDPSALLAARQQMSDTLDEIVAALGHEPTITGRPRRRRGVDLSQIPPEPKPAGSDTKLPPLALPAPQPESGLVLRYAFDTAAPFAYDLSGYGHHGRVSNAKRADGALVLADKGSVVLPSGLELLGSKATTGSISLWARPDFDPTTLSSDLYQGYAVLFYLMETDGNGLPDGYDEIGLVLHGPKLIARCGSKPALFATVDNPFAKGKWTHVALVWNESERRVYVDGKPVAVVKGTFSPAQLDGFAGTLGCHATHKGWPWQGALDEFRIYRRALSPDEVGSLAQGRTVE